MPIGMHPTFRLLSFQIIFTKILDISSLNVSSHNRFYLYKLDQKPINIFIKARNKTSKTPRYGIKYKIILEIKHAMIYIIQNNKNNTGKAI